MNIDELALKVGATHYSPAPMRAVRGWSFTFDQLQALIEEYEKDAGSEPVAYRTWRETKMYGMWEYRTDELELNDGDWEPIYARPDPRVAELEAEIVAQKAEWNKAYDIGMLAKHKIAELEAQNAALMVAIEAINGVVFSRPVVDEQWQLEILAISPSSSLLEARDRKRDAKLLRVITQRIQPQDSYQDDYFKAKVHSYNIVKELAAACESGEWKPEL